VIAAKPSTGAVTLTALGAVLPCAPDVGAMLGIDLGQAPLVTTAVKSHS
jgi:hypothetical protein